MNGNGCDWLPLLLLLAATAVALQGELRHATCDNEERYENQMMCAGKEFGCLVPYPDNCSLFLVCDCIYPTVKLCPAQLWWDNKTQGCNYPHSTKCIYYTFTSTEATPTLSTNKPEDNTTLTTLNWSSTTEENWPTSSYDPPPAPPGISETFCRKFPDGSVHRYPYDCNAYINCTLGWPVLNYCAADKVFNQWLLICDTPEVAQCEPLPLPSTTTTIVPTTTTPDDGQCSAPPLGIEDDFCWSLGNGFYVYPYDCSAYLSCRNGCTNLAYCIPGKLFNPLLHICDTPNSVNCKPEPYPTTTIATTQGSTVDTSTTIIPSTTVATTTPTPTTTTTSAPITLPPDVNENACRNYPDNTRFPYAANCSLFLWCKDHEVILGQCSNGLLFNPDFGICDEANDVYCYGDRTTSTSSTTAAPTTVTVPTTATPGPAELCEDQEAGASFPYVEDCSKYILCLGGGAYYIAPCAGGYYDPKSQACGPNVSPTACKETGTTTTTTTTTTPETTTTTTEIVTTTTAKPDVPAGICGGKDEGEMIAYPKDCSKYIVCVSPIPVAFYCLEGFYFNAKRQQCVSWQESDCDQEISTTPGYTSAPLEPTICTNSSRDTFPYLENCQWFIRCVDDYVYMMDVCNCGEYYDPIQGVCGADVPHDACRWDYTATTTTEATTESTTAITRPPPQKGPCDDVADGDLVPYPNDCSKYIKCSRPIASAFDCKEGEEFSPEFRKCMDASLANCNPGPTGPSTGTTPIMTTEISTTETTPSTTAEITTTETTPSTTDEISTTVTTPSTTDEISTTVTTPSTTEEISTTEVSTTELTTTTAPPSGICGGQVEGSLVPYPNVCSKYIKCVKPIPIGYDCPEGLEFSPTELKCMDPDLANCNAGPTPGSTTSMPPYSTDTTAASTTEEPCTSTPTITDSTTTDSTSTIIDTTTPLTTETDSTSTITDSTTTITDSTTTITDSTPTITDSTTDSTTEEPCTSTPTITDSTSAITDSTTTDSTTTTTTIHPDTPNICCGVALGTILPYPNDCNRYVVCDYPIPYSVVCPEGTAFNPFDLMCTAEGLDSCF
ncbi:mucin-5AC isoform X2 [Drosophila innubila]|uniref:mucin-5AC isoform X2 n=1 Tax=Drosophila innubila TaxID=198719 RepID=UPI00148CB5C1|nr:mucin-5AC isoform X2 [Drosophila innubila]